MHAIGSALLVALLMGMGTAHADPTAARQKVLATVDRTVAQGPFAATWESLDHYRIPAWYLDAKFGIFIHWGVYSVPAFGNEWYPREMYGESGKVFKHHVDTYGPQAKFGYKDFIPKFVADRFDPKHWASVFKKSGAKYVVPVAEHHDGFAMYGTDLSEWTATKMGPKRDLIGELASAVRKQGLHLGLSSHRAEHWWFFEGGKKFDSDVKDGKYADLYGPAQPKNSTPDTAFLDDWLARTADFVDRYKPELVWFDWWIETPAFKPYLQKFAAYYYNRADAWKSTAVINYKKEAMPEKAAVLDIERGKLDGIRPLFWQTDTSVCKKSWGYIADHDYKTAGSIIHDLVDVVSKNGSLLLNIGPRADGTIPEPQEQILLAIGKWLATNGEAIYGTRPWKSYGEGPTKVAVGHMAEKKGVQPFTAEDIRFTSKGKTLYAIALGWPTSGKLTIKSMAELDASSIQLLGSKAKLKWTRDAEGLHVELPKVRPGEHAWVLKIAPRVNS